MAHSNAESTILNAVYNTLKQGIMTLQLAPGTVMSTQEMATRLNVSRTPVREAFLRLQREGLIDNVSQRGTMVSRINLKRVDEERFIRESLELAVVSPFLRRCKPEHFQILQESIDEQNRCFREKRYSDFVDCDNQWHRLFFEVAQQLLAWETIINMNGHYNRIRILTVQNDETIQGAINQHSRIIEMMRQGQEDAVRSELANHVTKIRLEKSDLIRKYPDFFSNGEAAQGVVIGSL